VSPDSTLYDIASLTKVVGTTSAVMALLDDGRLALDAPVRRYVSAFPGAGKEAVTVRHLLEHRSGLAAGAPLWREGSPEAARRQALGAPLRSAPGRTVEYSDLGMIVLGAVVEAAAGESMDTYLERRVFAPARHAPDDVPARARGQGSARLARLAPTGTAASGRVHDGNAAALGGVAGHAGLFSTASTWRPTRRRCSTAASAPTACACSPSPRCARSCADRPGTPGGRSAGRPAAPTGTTSCGRLLDERAVMHTGFTGTFLVVDPVRQAFAVLLTNRVHAPRAAQPARVIRDVRADVADALALAVVDARDGPLAMPVAFRADRNAHEWHAVAPARTVARVAPRRPVARLAGAVATAGPSRGDQRLAAAAGVRANGR
jgi:CubicO group peptidase (beta-lactamase class C family)